MWNTGVPPRVLLGGQLPLQVMLPSGPVQLVYSWTGPGGEEVKRWGMMHMGWDTLHCRAGSEGKRVQGEFQVCLLQGEPWVVPWRYKVHHVSHPHLQHHKDAKGDQGEEWHIRWY